MYVKLKIPRRKRFDRRLHRLRNTTETFSPDNLFSAAILTCSSTMRIRCFIVVKTRFVPKTYISLFVYSFSDSVITRVLDDIASNVMERMWKEAVTA
jgi:hypothetical protein